ncbi:MAG: hypothetical protein AAF413_04345 [Patescibacteria group bacterium]
MIRLLISLVTSALSYGARKKVHDDYLTDASGQYNNSAMSFVSAIAGTFTLAVAFLGLGLVAAWSLGGDFYDPLKGLVIWESLLVNQLLITGPISSLAFGFFMIKNRRTPKLNDLNVHAVIWLVLAFSISVAASILV